jgi:hypothetical protein
MWGLLQVCVVCPTPHLNWSLSSVPPGTISTIRSPPGPRRIRHTARHIFCVLRSLEVFFVVDKSFPLMTCPGQYEFNLYALTLFFVRSLLILHCHLLGLVLPVFLTRVLYPFLVSTIYAPFITVLKTLLLV